MDARQNLKRPIRIASEALADYVGSGLGEKTCFLELALAIWGWHLIAFAPPLPN
jgi:hypothetical protein